MCHLVSSVVMIILFVIQTYLLCRTAAGQRVHVEGNFKSVTTTSIDTFGSLSAKTRQLHNHCNIGIMWFVICVCVCVSDRISFSPLVWMTWRICLGVIGASEKFSKTWKTSTWFSSHKPTNTFPLVKQKAWIQDKSRSIHTQQQAPITLLLIK